MIIDRIKEYNSKFLDLKNVRRNDVNYKIVEYSYYDFFDPPENPFFRPPFPNYEHKTYYRGFISYPSEYNVCHTALKNSLLKTVPIVLNITEFTDEQTEQIKTINGNLSEEIIRYEASSDLFPKHHSTCMFDSINMNPKVFHYATGNLTYLKDLMKSLKEDHKHICLPSIVYSNEIEV